MVELRKQAEATLKPWTNVQRADWESWSDGPRRRGMASPALLRRALLRPGSVRMAAALAAALPSWTCPSEPPRRRGWPWRLEPCAGVEAR